VHDSGVREEPDVLGHDIASTRLYHHQLAFEYDITGHPPGIEDASMEVTDVTFCTAVEIGSVELTRTKQYHARTFQISQHVPDTDTTTVMLQFVHNPADISRSLRARRLLDEHGEVGELSRALSPARRSSQAFRFRAEEECPIRRVMGWIPHSAGWDTASSRAEGVRSLGRVAEFLRPLVMGASNVCINKDQDARSVSETFL
jgi:hypothetical protein